MGERGQSAIQDGQVEAVSFIHHLQPQWEGCLYKETHILSPSYMPTCPRTSLKEATQWNLEELDLTASQCPR